MKTSKIIVLNYHEIVRDIYPLNPLPGLRYSVSEKDFISQMEVLQQLRIPVVSLDEISSGRYTHDFAVCLTFDDGNSSDYDIAYPILHSFNYTAAFFPVAPKVNTPGRITFSQLNELSERNFIIGSHGVTHSALTALTPAELKHELTYSKKLLEEAIHKPVRYFAAPYGLYNREILRQALDTGYSAILSTRRKANHHLTGSHIIDRWNIRKTTSIESFKLMLSLKGRLPFPMNLLSPVAESGKRILGPGLTNKIINYFSHAYK
jgi:peptidoglycan/xylan/chitin deacetylase (PgdA/CDA1 family)